MNPTSPNPDLPALTSVGESQFSEGIPTGLLMQSLYQDLRRLARSAIRGESPGQTLEPTALVHEVYLRLYQQNAWQSSQHFITVAATTMRRILIDRARLKGRRLHRGEERCEAPESFLAELTDETARELVELDDALQQLQNVDAVAGRVAELRLFAGLTLAEVAETLSISPSAAFREWSFARAWLKSQLTPDAMLEIPR